MGLVPDAASGHANERGTKKAMKRRPRLRQFARLTTVAVAVSTAIRNYFTVLASDSQNGGFVDGAYVNLSSDPCRWGTGFDCSFTS